MVKFSMSYPKKPLPSARLLRRILRYDANTGELFWRDRPKWTFRKTCPLKVVRSWNTQFPGKRAFYTPNASGHLNGYINGKPFTSHRVIWKMQTGKDPDYIDHIDGDPSNNTWENLRNGDLNMNYRNVAVSTRNTSGVMGVHWHTTNQTWTANIRVFGKLKHLGTFESKDEAREARRIAEQKYGYHKNHGRRYRCLGSR